MVILQNKDMVILVGYRSVYLWS